MESLRKAMQKRTVFIGSILLMTVTLLSILAPYISPHDPLEQNLSYRLKPPSWLPGGMNTYWLGTDQLGRDILSRIIYGARISLLVGFTAVLISGVVGVFLGLICGYYGGLLDMVIMRLADVQLSFPFILLVIAIVAVTGPSVLNVILIFGVAGWVIYARTARGLVLSLKEKEFVESAKALGLKDRTILVGHILPNILTSIIVIATVRIGNVIIWESGLSFLGLGIPPPIISWGRMLAEGRPYLNTAWWSSTFPGLAIVVIVLTLNQIGDSLIETFDPRLSSE